MSKPKDIGLADIKGSIAQSSSLTTRLNVLAGRVEKSSLEMIAHKKDIAQRPKSASEVANSDGSPGQQHRGAKRDQRKSRPIRLDP